jgi:hypothetical protein
MILGSNPSRCLVHPSLELSVLALGLLVLRVAILGKPGLAPPCHGAWLRPQEGSRSFL